MLTQPLYHMLVFGSTWSPFVGSTKMGIIEDKQLLVRVPSGLVHKDAFAPVVTPVTRFVSYHSLQRDINNGFSFSEES